MIDFEACGFGAGSYPIEVGFVLPDGRAFCSLIRPEPGWTRWDIGAEAVHGISRATLERHGRPPGDVADLLAGHLDGLCVYSDGWGHDFAWLHQLYDAAGREPGFRLESLRTLLSEEAASRWPAVKAAVLARTGLQRHRASSDARVLQLALQELLGQPVG
ncbi:hypothetical protein OOT46_01920 [Aquabacterium sp. A7-Y]|uniref:3'-5' exonuclease n=1 Tax=Aquabacterium sp. A7-Y TaxID=1349605 RepID=UPI00223D086E|nr:hypothetical protein [Aquabacterium sp. A7-Y]MCW7536613.1 hypothetical protein [Aquabacterium sp. A7-Y]